MLADQRNRTKKKKSMKEGREGVKAKIGAREDRQIRFSRAEASVFHYPGRVGRWVIRVARARGSVRQTHGTCR